MTSTIGRDTITEPAAPLSVEPLSATAKRELYRRFLDDQLAAEQLPPPIWGPIGREVYERTYSREIYKRDPETNEFVHDAFGGMVLENWWSWSIPLDGRTSELWPETARRVVQGNLAFAPADSLLPDEDLELFIAVYEFGMVPGGRHLWVTGTSNAFSRNCFVSGWSTRTSDHFRFLASRLFEGGGVGANYSSDLMGRTAPIISSLDVHVTIRPDHKDYAVTKAAAGDLWVDYAGAKGILTDTGVHRELVVDQREGWVDTWCRLVDMSTTPVAGDRHAIVVDVSDLRPHGTPLKTFGGRASGPAPLASSIAAVVKILNVVAVDKRRLAGLEAMEIDHEFAASIVAGGARRSARMSMKLWSDRDIFKFIASKLDQSKHWSTNISVEVNENFRIALRDDKHPLHAHAKSVLFELAMGMAGDGEPGMIDTSYLSYGENAEIRVTNPCGEIGLETDSSDAAGESCNLGSVNLDHYGKDVQGIVQAYRLAARFLLRATLNPYPDPAANRIEARNRRIGVGMMGLQGWVAEHGVKLSQLKHSTGLKDLLNLFRMEVREAADELADLLMIPRPVKVTCVPPTGSTSQMPGVTAGLHPVNAKFFLRRVRYVDSDPKLADLVAKGHTIVDDIYAANTKVVDFYAKDALVGRYGPDLIECADEIGFADFMDLVATIQDTFCHGADGNAVSATAILPAPPMKPKLDGNGLQAKDPWTGLPAEEVDKDRLAPFALAFAEDIARLLGRVKGITAFPNKARPLSPIEPISEADYELGIALLGEGELGDSNDGNCATGACPVK